MFWTWKSLSHEGLGRESWLYELQVPAANLGWRSALQQDPALALGLNTFDGNVVYGPVAEAHGLAHVELQTVLA